MYRCQVCGVLVPAGDKALTVVIEKRDKVYPPTPRLEKKGKKRRERGEFPGGRGWEIAREALACRVCYDRHMAVAVE